MILERFPEIQQLPISEQALLAGELWEKLQADPTYPKVSMELVVELEKRLEEFHRDPTKFTTWDAIQRRILGRTLSGD